MNDRINKPTTVDNFIEQTAANEFSAGLMNSAPLVGIRSHFRSRTFTSHIGYNSLISAAGVLLAFNEQVKEIPQHENLKQLHEDLVHEIRTFETNAQERGYAAETILIARYILCATLDETIVFSSQANTLMWQQYKLMSLFQNEQSTDERFFLIVDRLLSVPVIHLELLELVYLCLSLGFEGKYRYENKGHYQLNEIKDKLYQQIREVRQDPPKLFIVSDSNNKNNPPISFWMVFFKAIIIAFIFIGLIYGSFRIVFEQVSAPISKQIQLFLNSQ